MVSKNSEGDHSKLAKRFSKNVLRGEGVPIDQNNSPKNRTVPKILFFDWKNGFSRGIEKNLINSTGPKNNQKGHP